MTDYKQLADLVTAAFDAVIAISPISLKLIAIPLRITMTTVVIPKLAENFRAVGPIASTPDDLKILIDRSFDMLLSLVGKDNSYVALIKPIFNLFEGPVLQLVWKKLVELGLVIPTGLAPEGVRAVGEEAPVDMNGVNQAIAAATGQIEIAASAAA